MKHLVVPFDVKSERDLELTGKDYHYLKNVRRISRGDSFMGLDQAGRKLILTVIGERSNSLMIHASPSTEEETRDTRTQLPSLTLYQSIPKGKLFDQIVRQATEAGVSAIIPIISRYTVVDIDDSRGKKKLDRWKRIAREAVQQSGRKTIPEVHEPVLLGDVIKSRPAGFDNNVEAAFVFHEKTNNSQTLHQSLDRTLSNVHLFIGPEGGFSQEEVEELSSCTAISVSLGETVLRAHTAALFALAAVKIILLERGAWRSGCEDDQ